MEDPHDHLHPSLIQHAAAELLDTDACDLEAELTKILDADNAETARQVEDQFVQQRLTRGDVPAAAINGDDVDGTLEHLAEIVIGNAVPPEPAAEPTYDLWLQVVQQ